MVKKFRFIATLLVLVGQLSGVLANPAHVAADYEPITITTDAALPNAVAGEPWVAFLTATGGDGAYDWSVAEGFSLPDGLTITGGQIFGVVSCEGEYGFDIEVNDLHGGHDSRSFTITVDPYLDPGDGGGEGGGGHAPIIDAGVPDAELGVVFSYLFQATDGTPDYAWTFSGDLPDGINLNGDTGELGGEPTVGGDFTFDIICTDAALESSSVTCHIHVYDALSFTDTTLMEANLGVSYSVQLGYDGGGTGVYFYDDGDLPSGLSLSEDGLISGLPTTPGAVTFYVYLTDEQNALVYQEFTIDVHGNEGDPPQITTVSVDPGEDGVDYSFAIQATGGDSGNTWSTSGTLPDGLTVDSDTGVLHGMPTDLGSYNFDIILTDSLNQFSTYHCTLTVYGALAFMDGANLPDTNLGEPYDRQLDHIGGPPGYHFSIPLETPLPPGLTMDGLGHITGTPNTPGSYTFTVYLQDNLGGEVTRDFHLRVLGDLPSISTASLPNAEEGVDYTQSITAVGGYVETGYDWMLIGGDLPEGVTLDATTGIISGVPEAGTAGTFTFTVKATDAGENSCSKQFTITVYTRLLANTGPLEDGTVGQPYSVQLLHSGNSPYVMWRIEPTDLPDGLVAHKTTGVIDGTPGSSGTFTIHVTLDDGLATSEETLTLTINDASPLDITTMTLPHGAVGTDYSQTLHATGGSGSYAWRMADDSDPLPPGLELDPDTGEVHGLPTVPGTYDFTITVDDSISTFDLGLRIIVDTAESDSLTVVTTSLPHGTHGQPYFQPLDAGGGTGNYTWSLDAGPDVLPPGLWIDPENGIIGGTCTQTGTFTFTVVVHDGETTASQELTLTVDNSAPGTLAVATNSLDNGQVEVNKPYTFWLQASGGRGPYTWSVTSGSLPGGLTLNPGTGEITGPPGAEGSFTFTLTVTDADMNTANRSFDIYVWGELTISTGNFPDGYVGSHYSQTADAAGGSGPNWKVDGGALPDGLELDEDTGVISGTPTTTGTFTFELEANDGITMVHKEFTITIHPAVPLRISSASPPPGDATSAYTQTLSAAGGSGDYTWSITAGSLPDGLELDEDTGVISGTPTTPGTSNFTVQADDGITTITKPMSITINPSLGIPGGSPPAGDATSAYSQSLSGAGGSGNYNWSIASGSLPDGLSLDASTGVISGTPTAPGTSNFTVQASDGITTTSKPMSITINPALGIPGGSPPAGDASSAYSQSLSGAGGSGSYNWSLASGSLPAGLSMDASTGVISGTPTTPGTSNFTVQASDGITTTSKPMSITINPALGIPGGSPPSGDANSGYSQSLYGAGGSGAYNWSLASGSLPAGLSLDSSTGNITGTPTTPGTSNFTVQASDGITTTSKPMSITINPALGISTPGSLPGGTPGSPYSQALSPSGGSGNNTWSLSDGSGPLPDGLSLDPATGVISGTPTTPGSYPFDVKIDDGISSTTKHFDIDVGSESDPLSVTTASLPGDELNVPYSQALVATGGSGSYTWSVSAGSLPAGLTLHADTGVIDGLPTVAGTSSFTVQVNDGLTSAARALAITVNAALSITTDTLPSVALNASYSQTLTAAGGSGSYIWCVTVGSLPTGLTLHTDTGIIDGTPTTAGTSNFTVQAGDGQTTTTKALSITVDAALAITTASLPSADRNSSYSQTLAAGGGTGGYTWAVTLGSLPAGLTLHAATGVIDGTPTATGTANFTVQVNDGTTSVTKALSISVNNPLNIQTPSLPDTDTGCGYSRTLSAAGGSGSYTWSVSTGSLPTGFTLHADTGVIDGTPSASGTFNFTVQVDDGVASVTKAFSIVINPALSVTTGSLPAVTINTAYSQTLGASGGLGTQTWSVISGSLPAGLTLRADTGVIEGTPTSAGMANFTVSAFDGVMSANRNLSITVNAALGITTATLPSAPVNTPYSQTLAAAGGSGSYTWSVTAGSLPTGLTLHADTGVIDGTPTLAATSNFTVQVNDGSTTATRALAITIDTALSISTSSLPAADRNSAYSQTLTAGGGTGSYTWSVTLGTLPAGLSLHADTGVIDGTPTATGTSNFTVQVNDGATSVTKALSITVNTALVISTSSFPAADCNSVYTQTLTSTGGAAGKTWSVTAGSLPTGLTLHGATGVIDGTPTVTGTFNFTIQVGDTIASVTKALSITVNSALSISTVSPIPSADRNSAYSHALAAAGGSGSYTWTITAGSLPSGLILHGASGVVDGTPTATGAFSFTVLVNDGTATVSKTLSITVNSALVISTSSPMTAADRNSAYAQTLAAAGGSGGYTWAVTVGSLPAGLTLHAATGVIDGTPSAAGTSNFTVQVNDGIANVTKALSITVNAVLAISTASLPAADQNSAYAQTLTASGGSGTNTWSVTVGSLPTGLTLHAATGVIDGTPGAVGTDDFTVRVSDGVTSVTQALSITVNAALAIATVSLPASDINVGYSQTLSATGGSGNNTWSVTTGSLPTGLSLHAASGVIDGTPTVAGIFNFTVQANDGIASVTRALSITIHAAINISTVSLPSGTLNSAYAQTLAAAGGNGSNTWSLNVGSLPAGLTLHAATGVIDGTPTATGTASFTVQVSDGTTSATRALSVTIYTTLSVTTLSLPDSDRNAAYSQTLAATGGSGSYTWSVTISSLPTGLTLNPATGVIDGTPTVAGTSSFTVQANDGSTTVTKALSITVNTALSVTSASLPSGIVNAAYSQIVSAAGGSGTYNWAITAGSLPAGMNLHAATGLIDGTPTSIGISSFTIQANDGITTASVALSITINATLIVSTVSLPSSDIDAVYSQTLTAAGGSGTYTWSVTSGSIPAGLTLHSATGVIDGTPTAAGTSTFTVQANDGANNATRILSITINAALSVTTVSLPSGALSAGYSQTLSASGGSGTYTWGVAVGSLPAGLTLHGATGVIDGTPTATGTANFTVQASDGVTSSLEALSITVNSALVISTASLPSCALNSAYSQTLTATGGSGSYTWSVINGSLPAGLTLHAATGVIDGTATPAGSANFTVQVTAGSVKATAALSIDVNAALSVTTASLPGGVISASYSQTLAAAGGTGSYTWSVTAGSLPAGLTLHPATGVIDGTPTVAGTANFTVQVDDGITSAAKALSININTPLGPLNIDTASLSSGALNTLYSQTLAASGGSGSYTWSVTAGSVPAGLTLHAGTGAIDGTPTVAGTSNFTVQVSDGSTTAAAAFSIIVNSTLSVLTASLPTGTISTSYTRPLIANGGSGSYTWSVLAGSLPPGLTLHAATGVIDGKPTAAMTADFTVQVTSGPATASRTLSITITSGLSIDSTSLCNGITGTPYAEALIASGGTGVYTWSITDGALPPGLTIDGSMIDGIPEAPGTFTFTVRVMSGSQNTTQVMNLTIIPALSINTAALHDGNPGVAYSQNLVATGGSGSYTWSVSSGKLPAGLLLNGSAITGTPSNPGTSTFTLRVTDGSLAVSKSFNIQISAALAISPGMLPSAITGTPYTGTVSATGGSGVYSWSVSEGVLPGGLTLDSGKISGTPALVGKCAFTLRVSDGITTSSAEFSISVYDRLTVVTSSMPVGEAGVVFSQTLTAAGGSGANSWTIVSGTLPDGLALSYDTLSGITDAPGNFTFTVQVSDGIQTATRELCVAVNYAPSIVAISLPDGVVGTSYTQNLTAEGGTGTYTWSITSGSLPSGLNFSGGVISGRPAAAGSSSFTVQLSDGVVGITQEMIIVIKQGAKIATIGLPDAPVDAPYSQTLAATGGNGDISWNITSGTLPAGLTLDSATGTIGGIPATSGTYNLVLEASDDVSTTSQALSITVVAKTPLAPAPNGKGGLIGGLVGDKPFSLYLIVLYASLALLLIIFGATRRRRREKYDIS